MISFQPVISCMCVLLFNISYITDDILSARYKLSQYYLREFTEISLFSKDDKVPLPKLYVAMKWKRYINDDIQKQSFGTTQRDYLKEYDIASFKDIFQKVNCILS